jgi:hypothetical protein
LIVPFGPSHGTDGMNSVISRPLVVLRGCLLNAAHR